MEVQQAIMERRSNRRFLDEAVMHEDFLEIVRLSSYAPSWRNSQSIRYMLVEDRALQDEIAANCVLGAEYNAKIINSAPALVLVLQILGCSGFEPDGSFTTGQEDRWQMFDAGVACQTFCLAAHDLDYGTVIMGVFDHVKVGAAADIPASQQVAAMIAIGHPTHISKMPPRLAVEDLVIFR